MSNLAIIGDVHAGFERLTASLGLLEGARYDLAVLTGDLGLDPPMFAPARTRDRGRHDASVRQVLTSVQRSLDCPVVFVPGNHDLPDTVAESGATNIDGKATRLAGLRLAGLGGAGPAHFGFPYEWTEAQAEAALVETFEGATEQVDLFLSHTPPAETTLDRTFGGEHVGSVAVRRRIESALPRLFVSGHIHESFGLTQVAGVPCINAGALGPPAAQDIAWRVAWNDGPESVEMIRRDPRGELERRTWRPGT